MEKEDILIEAQLNKEQKLHTSPTISMPKPVLAPERAKLAELTGGGIPVSLSTRVEAIQMMADMCSRFEPKNGAVQVYNSRSFDSLHPLPEHTKNQPKFPMKCNRLQCLFCLGDGRLRYEHRIGKFKRPQALWDHAEKHLDSISRLPEVGCPHPICRATKSIHNSVEHNGVGCSIMEMKVSEMQRSVRTFR